MILDDYNRLRAIFRSYNIVLDEVATLGFPRSDSDELSFMKLTFLAYAILQERAKIHFDFLFEATEEEGKQYKETVRAVGVLRTYFVHSLSYENKQDQTTNSHALIWFKKKCNFLSNKLPSKQDEWKKAYDALAKEIESLFSIAINLCVVFESNENIENLKRRIDSYWPAHQFHPFIEDIVEQLGYEGINIKKFTDRHLHLFRKLLKLADKSKQVELLNKKITALLLEEMSSALPCDIKSISKYIPLESEAMKVFLIYLQEKNRECCMEESLKEFLHRLQKDVI